jgi:hypothetical protein
MRPISARAESVNSRAATPRIIPRSSTADAVGSTPALMEPSRVPAAITSDSPTWLRRSASTIPSTQDRDGKFGGTAGIDSFTEQRWVTIQHSGRPNDPF